MANDIDDLSSGFQTDYTPQQAAFLAEMERKSQDDIRVYNPTDTQFIVQWGGLGFPVPGKNQDLGYGPGQAILKRYIASNYVTKMIDKILGERRVNAVREANQKRISQGLPEMNKYQEQELFETQYKDNDPEARKKLIPLLWLGVEREWGMEVTQEQTAPQIQVDKELLAKLEKPAHPMGENNIDLNEVLRKDIPALSVANTIIPSTPAVSTPETSQPSAADALISSISVPNGQ